jgi:hypothetical protein
MTQIALDSGVGSPKSLRTWIFNPFYYLGGESALMIGIVLVLAGSLLGFLGHTHFDGVLDIHMGLQSPFLVFLFEGVINFVIMSLLLLFLGKIISKSHIRVIDVVGSQALARGPMLIAAVCSLLPGFQRYSLALVSQATQAGKNIQTLPSDPIVFGISMIITLLMVIWMVILMYRGFAVSCNVRGGKAIGVFVVAVLLGEGISKVAILKLILVHL